MESQTLLSPVLFLFFLKEEETGRTNVSANLWKQHHFLTLSLFPKVMADVFSREEILSRAPEGTGGKRKKESTAQIMKAERKNRELSLVFMISVL